MKESTKYFLGTLALFAVAIMTAVAPVAPAEVRFWFGFFPIGIILSFVAGLLVSEGISVIGRWGTILFIIATSLFLIVTQVVSQEDASRASDLRGNYDSFYPVLRGLIWWACSFAPMVHATFRVWIKPRKKETR